MRCPALVWLDFHAWTISREGHAFEGWIGQVKEAIKNQNGLLNMPQTHLYFRLKIEGQIIVGGVLILVKSCGSIN